MMWPLAITIKPIDCGDSMRNQNQHHLQDHYAHSMCDIRRQQELIQFLHAAAGSPVPATWIKAIENNQYTTWPGLTAQLVRKYLPKNPIATIKGHQKYQRQGVRSTKPTTPQEKDINPPAKEPNQRTHHVYASVEAYQGQIFSDQTFQPSPVGDSSTSLTSTITTAMQSYWNP
mmetsp:Transcript_13974/g.21310  ORF Transcript_13974/g.21310 Transcript_13974/m.21310 type:complete len:173 (-) Transcript_13974:96-614(-)